jgi:hypothetical protein
MRATKRTVPLLAALAAIPLTGALAASASAALPEFKVTGGTGSVKLVLGATPMSTHHVTIECLRGHAEFTVTTGSGTFSTALHLNGCRVPPLDGPCQSSKANSEEIVTSTLPVKAVYLSAAKHEAALDFNDEGATFAEFVCTGSGTLRAKGSILLPFTPVNKLQKAFTLAFTQSGGVQTPSTYEGAEGKLVEAAPLLQFSGVFEPGTITSSVEFSVVPNAELKA